MSRYSLRMWNPPITLSFLSLVGIGFIHLPLFSLVFYSFYAPVSGLGTSVGWTLYWYERLFENPELFSALWTSVWIASVVGLLSVFLGFWAALALQKLPRSFFKKMLESMNTLGLVIPEMVLGIALLIWFSVIRLKLGTSSMVLGHVMVAFPYATMVIFSQLSRSIQQYEDAAQDLGATPYQVLWKVTLPLMKPSLLSAFLIAFTLSFDDFIVAFFTSGVSSPTLPLKLYSMVRFGLTPEANAISTLIFAVTILFVWFASRSFFPKASSFHKKK
ncbi:MAG: spermidine/putrescine ABC transporter permease PotC [Bdellovibrionaceae bacterium]|nr:spermidine/putrescine ABC transporter permease PotC [Pseudobdellovibrionaceae bacterium]|tara:strand:+ start:6523 stop:7344 length:822 start_codon:yes stop_codon:yes gene_type:complete